MVKLGIIAFANFSGLGNQTKRLCEMLKPYRVLVVNSSGFSQNKEQNWHWYDQFSGYKVDGFPNNREIKTFVTGLTHVLVCENPLNFSLLSEAKKMGVKVFIQSNYEFCDHLKHQDLLPPDLFLMPSYWKISEMKDRFGSDRVLHLPPPINPNEFSEIRELNFARNDRPSFVHIVGTLAAHDRNGTLDLLGSLQYTEADFTLTIKSQHDLPSEYISSDKRVVYQIGNQENVQDLYKNFDAMILPRRYGGLALTVNEALMSGLPVIMTDISPNRELLPSQWLVNSTKKTEFRAREIIDVYSAFLPALARKIDWICAQDYDKIKPEAFEIGYKNFSETMLSERYEKLWSQQ